MEFGGEVYDQQTLQRVNPDQMDNMIKQGKTPEQFLSNYDFDETARDVIVFRIPTLRDVQVYDVVKTIDGLYGLVVGIQTLPYAICRNATCNFTNWSKNAQTVNINPTKEIINSGVDYSTMSNTTICQLEILRPYSNIQAKDLKVVSELLNTDKLQKCAITAYPITAVIEIHKNIHQLTKITNG